MRPDPAYQKWRYSILVITILFLLVVLAIVWEVAPKTSTVVIAPGATVEEPQHINCILHKSSQTCVSLPIFSGESLTGAQVSFPNALTTDYTLMVMLFSRDQQNDVLDWLPLVAELEESYPDVSSYGLSILPNLAPYIRLIAQAGFRLALDDRWHNKLVMVFLEDREVFLHAMDIPDYDNIWVFVMDGDGKILWHINGVFTEDKGERVRQQIELLHQDSE